MCELDGDIVHLPQSLAAKEIRCVVVSSQDLLILWCDNRCKLLQVTYHEQLYATERLCSVAVAAEHRVDGIEKVGADHGDLVDDDHVEGGDNAPLGLGEVEAVTDGGTRNIRRKRQLKEGVDGDTPGIDGSHAGRCHDNHAFGGVLLDGLEESRLTGPGLSREEDARTGMLHKLPGLPQFGIILALRGGYTVVLW